jgi:hypothetical protein
MKTNTIKIWAPKYSTNEVLVGSHHVASGVNEIVFTKAPHLEGKVYLLDGQKIRSYPKQPNGKGYVYKVPMSDLILK